jgi:MYXO-CTERM domain-containing protein
MDHETASAEDTDYAARAKALLKKTAHVGALVIVPICLAVHAHASVILPTSATCSIPGGSGCSAGATQQPDQNGVKGFSLGAGDEETTVQTSGGSGNFTDIQMSVTGPLTIDTDGSNCNGVGSSCNLSSLLFSWNAEIEGFISGGPGQPNLSGTFQSWQNAYSIQIQLDGTTIYFANGNPTVTDNGLVEGLSGSASVPIPVELQSKIANLVAGSAGGDINLTVSIGSEFIAGGSFNGTADMDYAANFSVAAEPAPEPATTGLALVGLSGLGAWLRRRKRA